MLVRKAEKKDMPEVLAVYRAIREKPTKGCTWTEDYPTDEDLLTDLERESLFLLEEDGAIIGGAAAEADEVPEMAPCDASLRSVELSRVGILPCRQGQGLAGKLVSAVLAMLAQEGVQAVRLLVSPANQAAVKTYSRCGFQPIGEGDRYGVHWLLCERMLGTAGKTD